MNLDGINLTTVVESALSEPVDIVADTLAQRLVWIDRKLDYLGMKCYVTTQKLYE